VGHERKTAALSSCRDLTFWRSLSSVLAGKRWAVCGDRDLTRLMSDPDLAPLRDRPNFRPLILDFAFPAYPFARVRSMTLVVIYDLRAGEPSNSCDIGFAGNRSSHARHRSGSSPQGNPETAFSAPIASALSVRSRF
jgi:hypothetical protein